MQIEFKIRFSIFCLWILLISTLRIYSGLNDGFLPLALLISPLIIILTLNLTYRELIIYFFIPLTFFLVITILNFIDFSFSSITYCLSLVFYKSLNNYFHKDEFLDNKKLIIFGQLISIAVLIFIFISFLFPDSLLTFDKYPVPRFRYFSDEPSNAGLILAPLIFIYSNFYVSIFRLLSLALTFSFTGYLLFLLLLGYKLFKKNEKFFSNFLLISFISFIVILFININNDSIFFINSGFIRFIGLKAFENLDFLPTIFGHGFSAANNLMKDFFLSFNIEVPNTFLLGTIYDLGILPFSISLLLLSRCHKYLYFPIFFINYCIAFTTLPPASPYSYLVLGLINLTTESLLIRNKGLFEKSLFF